MDRTPPKREQQTERIATIARRLFAQKGVNETSLEDIAKVCGFRKATLYYYFKSKDEILEHVFQRQWKRNEAIAALLKPEMNLEQILYVIGSNYLISLDQEENIEFMKIMLSEGLKNNKFHKAFLEFMESREPDAKLRSLFKEKMKGKGSPDEVRLFFFQFLGALSHHALHTQLLKLENPFKMDDEQYLRQLCRIFAKGF